MDQYTIYYILVAILIILVVMIFVCFLTHSLISPQNKNNASEFFSNSRSIPINTNLYLDSNKDNISGKKKLTFYYANWCGHCKSFMDQWNLLQNFVNINNLDLKMEKIDSDKLSQKILEEKNITGFPTLILTSNGKEYIYDGERTIEHILYFVASK